MDIMDGRGGKIFRRIKALEGKLLEIKSLSFSVAFLFFSTQAT